MVMRSRGMKVPFTRVWLTDSDKQAVMDVLDSGYLTYGPVTKALEAELRGYFSKPVVMTSSCSAALTMAFAKVVDEKWPLARVRRPEIITTPMTYVATALCIDEVGATPVFADIDPTTWCISPDSIVEKITSDTIAIAPVHWGGNPCEMDAILSIADKYNLAVIEDCAQSIGAVSGCNLTGTFAKAGCFSFYPTKQIGATDAGCVVCDPEDEEWFRMAIHAGSNKKIPHEGKTDVFFRGWKANCNDVDSALILGQFKRLQTNLDARKAIARTYDKLLPSYYQCQSASLSTRYLYPVIVPPQDRDNVIAQFKRADVGVIAQGDPVLTEMTYFRENYGTDENTCPVASRIAASTLSLPVFPQMTGDQIEYVIKTAIEIAE
jgi:dTDP-4-amino-4,6-dideoxygalactose transaminase